MSDVITGDELRKRMFQVLGISDFMTTVNSDGHYIEFTWGSIPFTLPLASVFSDETLREAFKVAFRQYQERELKYHETAAKYLRESLGKHTED